MSKRGFKIAALVLSGSVLLQFAGCAAAMAEQLLSTIAGSVFSAVIQNILNAVSTSGA